MTGVKFNVLPDQRLVVSVFDGTLGPDELLSRYRQLYSDPRWEPGFDEIADASLAVPSGVTPNVLRALVDLRRRSHGNYEGTYRTALIAPHDWAYGLGRMYQAYTDHLAERIEIFRNAIDALAWMTADISCHERPELRALRR